jgi:hypothetical protein
MKRTFKCGICAEPFPNPISVRRHRAQDHQPKPASTFKPQTVAELETEFDNLRTKIEAMVLYERGMAEGLRAEIAEHEENATKYHTLLTSVNEFKAA